MDKLRMTNLQLPLMAVLEHTMSMSLTLSPLYQIKTTDTKLRQPRWRYWTQSKHTKRLCCQQDTEGQDYGMG